MIDWKANLREFENLYRPLLSSCYMVGSLVYQSRFLPNSDIDLVSVIDNLDIWRFICTDLVKTPQGFAEESIKKYFSGEAQYLCLNYDFKGIPYSVDFLLPDFFRRASRDLLKGETVIYHRITDKPIEDGYEFGSGPKRISPSKRNYRQRNSILVETPLCIVDQDFYFGLHLDKLITGYQTLWGEEKDLIFFCCSGIKQMQQISRLPDIGDVLKSLNRYARLPEQYVLSQTQRYQKLLLAA